MKCININAKIKFLLSFKAIIKVDSRKSLFYNILVIMSKMLIKISFNVCCCVSFEKFLITQKSKKKSIKERIFCENLWFLINTHTLAIDKRACSILAIIRSISELFWSGVGAHVTVDGSAFDTDIGWCKPLIDDKPTLLLVLFVMILDMAVDAIVYLLLCPKLDDVNNDDVILGSIICSRDFDDDDLVLYVDFNSNCNSSHLTVSNAAWDD